MIGTLINQFDNTEKNTVRAFNKLFKISLDFPKTSTVEIGRLSTSTSSTKRFITVTNKKTKKEVTIEKDFDEVGMMSKPNRKKKATYNTYRYSAINFNNEVIARAENMKDLAKILNVSDQTIKNRLKYRVSSKNKVTKETAFNITRVKLREIPYASNKTSK